MMMFGLPLAAALERKTRERKSGNCSRWRDATRRGGLVSNYLGIFLEENRQNGGLARARKRLNKTRPESVRNPNI
jgi:hypothetical protein